MVGINLIAKVGQVITLALLITITNPPISHSAGREVVAAANTVKSGSGVPSTKVSTSLRRISDSGLITSTLLVD